ncbi:MAG TPA: hypothetical protein VF630_08350 [Hymenobacter sp.]|jgi:urocanate hydratase
MHPSTPDAAELNLEANSISSAPSTPKRNNGQRPMFYEFKPEETVKAARGTTGTPEKAERLRRVLTTDPGMGLFRPDDAGYELAQGVARERGAKIPGWR